MATSSGERALGFEKYIDMAWRLELAYEIKSRLRIIIQHFLAYLPQM
jgi:hypothetical protein